MAARARSPVRRGVDKPNEISIMKQFNERWTLAVIPIYGLEAGWWRAAHNEYHPTRRDHHGPPRECVEDIDATVTVDRTRLGRDHSCCTRFCFLVQNRNPPESHGITDYDQSAIFSVDTHSPTTKGEIKYSLAWPWRIEWHGHTFAVLKY